MWIPEKTPVKVIDMGHLIEVRVTAHANHVARIKKIDKDHYVVLETGEIKEIDHMETRRDSYDNLLKTFKNIRYLVNNNFDGLPNELFLTVTYKRSEQTKDSRKVYEDIKKFFMRLRYKYKSKTTIDYFTVVEPHASGFWHAHILLRFNDLDKVYIENSELATMWRHGFVTVRSLRNVDNIGAYVSAYLSDVELTDETASEMALSGRSGAKGVKEVNGKKYIKGGRLHMYPPGMNIYRASRGIKKPVIENMRYEKAKEKIGSAKPTYEKRIVFDNGDFHNETIVQQYNLKRF